MKNLKAFWKWKARICRARCKTWRPRNDNANHWSPKHLKLKGKADEKTAKDAETKARILKEYPYLEARATSKKSDHALAAANIKRELARKFPGVKFSIRSESYSGGCSVNVDWTDGPLTEKVQAVCNKYKDSYFDSMVDLKSYTPTNWTETFGGADHVFSNRHESLGTASRGFGRARPDA